MVRTLSKKKAAKSAGKKKASKSVEGVSALMAADRLSVTEDHIARMARGGAFAGARIQLVDGRFRWVIPERAVLAVQSKRHKPTANKPFTKAGGKRAW